jgi:hypothetical protein
MLLPQLEVSAAVPADSDKDNLFTMFLSSASAAMVLGLYLFVNDAANG